MPISNTFGRYNINKNDEQNSNNNKQDPNETVNDSKLYERLMGSRPQKSGQNIVNNSNVVEVIDETKKGKIIKTDSFRSNNTSPTTSNFVQSIEPNTTVISSDNSVKSTYDPIYYKNKKVLLSSNSRRIVESPSLKNYPLEKVKNLTLTRTRKNKIYLTDECELCNCTNGFYCGSCSCMYNMIGFPFFLWLMILIPIIIGTLVIFVYFSYNSPLVNYSKIINKQSNKTIYNYQTVTYYEYIYLNNYPCVGYGTTTSGSFPAICNQTTTKYMTSINKYVSEYSTTYNKASSFTFAYFEIITFCIIGLFYQYI